MKVYLTIFFLSTAAVCTFGDTSYRHYKVYAGKETNLFLWTYQYNSYFTYDLEFKSEGTLPAGLTYAITERSIGDFCKYYTGVVSGTTLATDNTYDSFFHCWRTSEDSQGNPDEQHYYSNFQVDDYADRPDDLAYLGSLPALTNWSDDETFGWSNGFLTTQYSWHDLTIAKDVDVFKVSCTSGVFCVETKATGALNFYPLEITVYEDDGSGNYGRKLAENYEWNVFDNDGRCNKLNQRLYFKAENIRAVFIKIRLYDDPAVLFSDYAIRFFKAQPVILIHGINAQPLTESDEATSFGDLGWILPYIEGTKPSWCYDFPWDSLDNGNKDGFKRYVGENEKEPETLYEFVYNACDFHDFKANIIIHSMGGFLIRFQLDKAGFPDMIDQVIFINSPQYGSDLANFLYRRRNAIDSPGAVLNLLGEKFNIGWNTSIPNAHHLMRGSDTIYEMHSIGTVIPPKHIACTIGTEKGEYSYLPLIMEQYDKFLHGRAASKFLGYSYYQYAKIYGTIRFALRDQYCKGLEHSDGIVPVSSQNMKSLHPDIESVYIKKCHTDAQKLYEGKFSDARQLFNLIKNRINQ